MNALRVLLAGFAVVALTAGVRAEKKDNAKLLVGTWEVTKSFEKGPPVGATVEFGKDGSVKGTHKADGKDVTHGGTYKLDGDKIDMVMKDGDKESKRSVTIKKISATELTLSHDDMVIELKRKK
jgi:uncharacterized protein (TIGR03066 family)